jgi:multidrug efflux pump subunit AcrB
MAEAVMFAMIWSFILSRTLVPTMAMYLLQRARACRGREAPPPSRNPLVRFQRGFERRFERFRGGYRDLLALALRTAPVFVIGFLAFVAAVVLLVPFSAELLSPRSMPARS